jgi:peroxiredoxin
MKRMGSAAALLLALAAIGTLPPAARGAANESPSPINLYPLGSGGEYAAVVTGETAPDFSYLVDGRWHRLRDLRSQGHVLLVVGAGEAQLRSLEAQREDLVRLGVVPVAVLDQRSGRCRATSERLGLRFTVISDPTRVIAAQLNALDERTRQAAPAWFVVDRRGTVRALAHARWPETSWREVAISSLGLTPDGATVSTSYHGR